MKSGARVERHLGLRRLQRGCRIAGGLTYTEAAAVADAAEARAEPMPQSPAPTAEAAAAALVRAVNAVAFATAAAQEEPAGNAALSQAELAGLHCQQQNPHSLLCCQTWTEASEFLRRLCRQAQLPLCPIDANQYWAQELSMSACQPVAVDAKAAASAAEMAA